MSNLNLIIGGRPFTVACADGEEDHVTSLGKMIDAKLATMEPLTGQNEVRMLLFAALLLADELHDVRQKSPGAQATSLPPGMADRLNTIAGQIENIALRLEGAAGNA
ncbi:MAG: cell division protein ZapA [Novosphingobium sp.]